ncbi:MAG TPA: T9SS type A sorting domain-containing protein [Bacteroidota bacterium]|nr:T9SS type A sorting domain-containing protein [Bacteroidota bacterium]
MIKSNLIRFIFLVAIILTSSSLQSQEFPVAVGSDTTFSCGAVYGGENGIVAVQGDSNSQYSINAQIVAEGGTLVGPRISLGAIGVPPGATPIFDGTYYFLIWREFNGDLKGQYISASGSLLGNALTIATNVSIDRSGSYGIALGDSTYLVVFTKTDDYAYGQFVNARTGNLVGSQIQISFNQAREISLAYDGENFLVTWVEIIHDTDKDIYGQFVSKAGSLVGNNFQIDGGPNYSDNPTSLAFDGARYFLVYHEMAPTSRKWSIMGRFITTSGTLQETITICDTSLYPIIASVAFDNENYFVTWTQLAERTMRGRFYNKSGIPIDTSFVVIDSSEGKVPIGGVGFGGGKYLVVATKVDSNFTDGDVYARFISPLTSVSDKEFHLPENATLLQNYPNPFNSATVINYKLPVSGHVTLKVFNLLGEEVATLINDIEPSGNKSVTFDAGNLASGIYFYRIQTETYIETKKLILLK